MTPGHDDADIERQPEDLPVYSRAVIGGKNDDEIRFRCPYELKQIINQLAHSYGMTESEFMRDLATIRAYGLEHYKSVMAAKAVAVAGVLREGGASVEQGGAR
jgi:predicted DNA-binding protein